MDFVILRANKSLLLLKEFKLVVELLTNLISQIRQTLHFQNEAEK